VKNDFIFEYEHLEDDLDTRFGAPQRPRSPLSHAVQNCTGRSTVQYMLYRVHHGVRWCYQQYLALFFTTTAQDEAFRKAILFCTVSSL